MRTVGLARALSKLGYCSRSQAQQLIRSGCVLELTNALMKGLRVSNGDFLRVKEARILRGGNHNTWLEIALDEGKNRHIRWMLEELGIKVLRLVRVAIGPVTLGDLAKGASRALTAEEKSALDSAMRASGCSKE